MTKVEFLGGPGTECGVQMFAPAGIASKEELEAIGGPILYGGEPRDVLAITQVCLEEPTGDFPNWIYKPIDPWEINVWGMDKARVEERAALVEAFIESRKSE